MMLRVSTGGDSDKKKTLHQNALNVLNVAQRSLADEESALHKLFDPVSGFGKYGEWKKLDGTCIEKDSGECVYFGSFCLDKKSLQLNLQEQIYLLCLFLWICDPKIKQGRWDSQPWVCIVLHPTTLKPH
jgi:hypothetical protein